jgi:3-oxoacyl-[acyl-carrier-protein] synthase-3
MIYIHGSGHFHPENIIDNQFLEELDIGTTNEWILERVGIESRRTVLPLDYIRQTKNSNIQEAHEASFYTNAQTGAKAGLAAIANAGLKREDIGLVISGSCTPQFSCPAEACTIAAEMDVDATAFDLNSACSSLAAQLNFINLMKEDALPDYILIVNPENNTRSMDYSDRNSAVLWGDCSSAMIISTRISGRFKVAQSMLTSTPKGYDKVQFPLYGHFKQDGRAVQTFAIKRSVSIINKFRETISGEFEGQVKFIGHQANLMMLNSVCHRTEIVPENHFYNVDKFGNCGAAGGPSVFSQYKEQFNNGDLLIIAVVGSGLSWGGVLIEVGENK